ncbi:MAG: hypothetical protein WCL57_15035 [Chloroflexota bacterium]
MARIIIYLQSNESSALLALSTQERRDPRQQAALLIRQRLEQLGLIQPPTPPAPALEAKP